MFALLLPAAQVQIAPLAEKPANTPRQMTVVKVVSVGTSRKFLQAADGAGRADFILSPITLGDVVPRRRGRGVAQWLSNQVRAPNTAISVLPCTRWHSPLHYVTLRSGTLPTDFRHLGFCVAQEGILE